MPKSRGPLLYVLADTTLSPGPHQPSVHLLPQVYAREGQKVLVFVPPWARPQPMAAQLSARMGDQYKVRVCGIGEGGGVHMCVRGGGGGACRGPEGARVGWAASAAVGD
jgi:hypothetical protein